MGIGIQHFYCLQLEAGFYSGVVDCLPEKPAFTGFYSDLVEGLPEDPATRVQFPAGTG